MCESLAFLFDNISVRLGNTLYRKVIGIPIGTNYAPLVTDLFLYCYEREFMPSHDKQSQADVISAFNDSSIYFLPYF